MRQDGREGRKERDDVHHRHIQIYAFVMYTISATLLLRQRYYNAMQLSKQQLTNFLFPVCSDNINHFPSFSL